MIFLTTAQLVPAYDGPSMLLIDSRTLKTASLTIDGLFLATVATHIYAIVMSG
jgi:hypothetical protein